MDQNLCPLLAKTPRTITRHLSPPPSRHGFPALPRRSDDHSMAARGSLPPLLSLLVAPEKHVALWAGVALCFIAQTAVVLARLLVSPRGGDDGWLFAGASIAGDPGGDGWGGVATTPAAWAAAFSVLFLAATLALWSTLLAGDGSRAAATHAARSAAAAAASAAAAEGLGMTSGALPPTGEHGGGDGDCRRRPGMGWGDPGFVIMTPGQDVRVLVDGVAECAGPPESRTLCQTCLVRKPMRSKVRGGADQSLFWAGLRLGILSFRCGMETPHTLLSLCIGSLWGGICFGVLAAVFGDAQRVRRWTKSASCDRWFFCGFRWLRMRALRERRSPAKGRPFFRSYTQPASLGWFVFQRTPPSPLAPPSRSNSWQKLTMVCLSSPPLDLVLLISLARPALSTAPSATCAWAGWTTTACGSTTAWAAATTGASSCSSSASWPTRRSSSPSRRSRWSRSSRRG